jgi:hypothetical protein
MAMNIETKRYLTPAEVSERWGGRVKVRTLANWRSQGSGPPFTKLGGAILYDTAKLAEWEQRATVTATSQYGANR